MSAAQEWITAAEQALGGTAESPSPSRLIELQAAAWRKIREIELLQGQIRERQQELANLNRRIAEAEHVGGSE